MKQIKKFLGVFLALAMVVGTIGLMPAMKALAAVSVTVDVSGLDNITATPTDTITVRGNYTITLEASALYTLPSSVKLVFETTELTSSDDYTYDDETGVITIANNYFGANDSGTLYIIAVGVRQTGTVSGTVTDGTDPIEGVTVTVLDGTTELGTATTGNDGTYSIAEVPTGTGYSVKFEATGYTTATATGIVVTKGGTATADQTLTTSGGGSVVADVNLSAISFSSETVELTVTVVDKSNAPVSGSSYLYIGEVNSKTGLVKAYNVYEITLDADGKVSLDVSAYSKKGVTLSIHVGTESAAKEIKIDKNAAKLKIALKDLSQANETARFEIKDGTTVITDFTGYQFKVEGGTWQDYTDAKLKAAIAKMEQFGTTIYIRVLGTDSATAATFSSTEAKVKYPALGKQPAVTIDYVKNSVKFPKGVEVIGIIATADGTVTANSWTALAAVASKAGSVDISALVPKADIAGEINFMVRTAANLKKPKTAITPVKIDARADSSTLASDITITKVPKSASDSSLKGIKIKNNNTTYAIEYQITAGTATEPDATAKWTKVNSGAEKTINDAAAEGKKLWVRIPGSKAVASSSTPAVRVSDYVGITINVESPTTPEVTTKSIKSFTAVTLTGTYTDADAVLAALPATITVTLEDDTTTATIPVTWADTDSYDAATDGSYIFTATWGTFPEGVDNDDNVVAPTVTIVISGN